MVLGEFWTSSPYNLMFNNKAELQEVMTAAIKIRVLPGFKMTIPNSSRAAGRHAPWENEGDSSKSSCQFVERISQG